MFFFPISIGSLPKNYAKSSDPSFCSQGFHPALLILNPLRVFPIIYFGHLWSFSKNSLSLLLFFHIETYIQPHFFEWTS